MVDFGLATINIFGVLLTLFSGTSLLHKEIEKKTIYLLLTKPMHRFEFVVGKHIGLSITLFVVTMLMTAFFYGLLYLTLGTLDPVYLSVILLGYFELTLLVALAILFSTVAPPTMSAVYTLGIYIVGHFSKDLVHFGKMSENPTLIKITEAIYYTLPDLEKLNIKNIVLYSNGIINPEILSTGVIYSITYTLALLILAMLMFEFKEF